MKIKEDKIIKIEFSRYDNINLIEFLKVDFEDYKIIYEYIPEVFPDYLINPINYNIEMQKEISQLEKEKIGIEISNIDEIKKQLKETDVLERFEKEYIKQQKQIDKDKTNLSNWTLKIEFEENGEYEISDFSYYSDVSKEVLEIILKHNNIIFSDKLIDLENKIYETKISQALEEYLEKNNIKFNLLDKQFSKTREDDFTFEIENNGKSFYLAKVYTKGNVFSFSFKLIAGRIYDLEYVGNNKDYKYILNLIEYFKKQENTTDEKSNRNNWNNTKEKTVKLCINSLSVIGIELEKRNKIYLTNLEISKDIINLFTNYDIDKVKILDIRKALSDKDNKKVQNLKKEIRQELILASEKYNDLKYLFTKVKLKQINNNGQIYKEIEKNIPYNVYKIDEIQKTDKNIVLGTEPDKSELKDVSVVVLDKYEEKDNPYVKIIGYININTDKNKEKNNAKKAQDKKIYITIADEDNILEKEQVELFLSGISPTIYNIINLEKTVLPKAFLEKIVQDIAIIDADYLVKYISDMYKNSQAKEMLLSEINKEKQLKNIHQALKENKSIDEYIFEKEYKLKTKNNTKEEQNNLIYRLTSGLKKGTKYIKNIALGNALKQKSLDKINKKYKIKIDKDMKIFDSLEDDVKENIQKDMNQREKALSFEEVQEGIKEAKKINKEN